MREVADLVGRLLVEPFVVQRLDQALHPLLARPRAGGGRPLRRSVASCGRAYPPAVPRATRATSSARSDARVLVEQVGEQREPVARRARSRAPAARRADRSARAPRSRTTPARARRRPPGARGRADRAAGRARTRRRAPSRARARGAIVRRRLRVAGLGDVDDLRLRVRIVGQPARRRGRAGCRPSRARSRRREAPARARSRATVPTSKRVSPPPTSLPRSMSTTPNSPSPRSTRCGHQRGSAARTRAAEAARAGTARCRAGTSA